MAQKVVLNLPKSLPAGVDVEAILDEVPRVGEYIVHADFTYRVVKVMHPMGKRGGFYMCRAPVIYLGESRPTSERDLRYVPPNLSVVPDTNDDNERT